MDHYTLAEKAFIAENHSNVILESYSFGSGYNDIGSGEAVREESTFRDLNTRHPCRRIRFTGYAQFISENENVVPDTVPVIVFGKTTDTDDRSRQP